jgi:hypothetical protein
VAVGVALGVPTVGVRLTVGVRVLVEVGTGVRVRVAVLAGRRVLVGVSRVAVLVAVGVVVAVGVSVGVGVFVRVGAAAVRVNTIRVLSGLRRRNSSTSAAVSGARMREVLVSMNFSMLPMVAEVPPREIVHVPSKHSRVSTSSLKEADGPGS